MSKKRHTGQVVVGTGDSGGMGRATLETIGARGAVATLMDVRRRAGRAVAS